MTAKRGVLKYFIHNAGSTLLSWDVKHNEILLGTLKPYGSAKSWQQDSVTRNILKNTAGTRLLLARGFCSCRWATFPTWARLLNEGLCKEIDFNLSYGKERETEALHASA